MEAGMAFISIIAIIAIVLVAGGLIAFIGHMIIGAFDGNKQSTKSEQKGVIDYTQYKQLEDSKQNTFNADYNFEAINESKAQKEKAMLESEKENIFELDEDKDEDLEAIENRLKESEEEKTEKTVKDAEKVDAEVVGVAENEIVEDEEDDFNLDDMLNEISEEVIEEEQAEASTEMKMSDELASYTIDDMLKQAEENNDEEIEEEPANEVADIAEVIEEETITEEIQEEFDDMPEEDVEDIEEEIEEVSVAQSVVNSEVEELKAQLAELNRQLELARTAKVEVVKIDITEEECVEKIEVLEERLKNVKKDYKINMKEYRPLKKVMNDLERYQTKLRRKEAIVAKKKVALYGVNNYVDIDKEKAEKLANELELLDGLRLSVNHCEEVINANKDRFPILEHTNQILEDQIAHLESDLAQAQETLKKIRERNGNGENNSEGNSEE